MASQVVFDTAQLLEMILLCLSTHDIIVCQRISKGFSDLITSSTSIQDKILLHTRKPPEIWAARVYHLNKPCLTSSGEVVRTDSVKVVVVPDQPVWAIERGHQAVYVVSSVNPFLTTHQVRHERPPSVSLAWGIMFEHGALSIDAVPVMLKAMAQMANGRPMPMLSRMYFADVPVSDFRMLSFSWYIGEIDYESRNSGEVAVRLQWAPEGYTVGSALRAALRTVLSPRVFFQYGIDINKRSEAIADGKPLQGYFDEVRAEFGAEVRFHGASLYGMSCYIPIEEQRMTVRDEV